MGDDIDAVVAAVEATVSERANVEYILVRFNDPSVSSAFKTTCRDDFLTQLRSIVPSGGGDCPEFAFTGIKVAIEASREKSDLYVFTDAEAKDFSILNQVANLASEKRIRINVIKTGGCRRRRNLRQLSPVVSASSPLEEIAILAGGTLFEVSTDDISEIFKLVAPRATTSLALLFRAKGDGSSGDEFPILIDEEVSTVIFTVQVRGNAFSLLRPDGTKVVNSDDSVDIVLAGVTSIISIEGPDNGEWKVILEGSGPYNIFVEGDTDLEALSFSFVRLVFGRELAYGPVSGSPIGGMEQTVLAKVIGDYDSVSLCLIREDGSILLDLSSFIGPGIEPASEDEILGSFIVPTETFGVIAKGQLDSGTPFQRVFSELFAPQLLSVELDFEHLLENSRGFLSVGKTNQIQYIVTNEGTETKTYLVSALDDLDQIQQVLPTSFELGPSESKTVMVELLPTACGEGDVLILNRVSLQASTDDESNVNTEAVTFVVTCNNDPECGDPGIVVLEKANKKFVDIDIASSVSITDPDGDDLTLTVKSIHQNEPVVESKGTKNDSKKKSKKNKRKLRALRGGEQSEGQRYYRILKRGSKKAGSDKNGPDAYIMESGVVSIRAESDKQGDGRVYDVLFEASDPNGGSCEGHLYVMVPSKKKYPLPDMPAEFLYDSTTEESGIVVRE